MEAHLKSKNVRYELSFTFWLMKSDLLIHTDDRSRSVIGIHQHINVASVLLMTWFHLSKCHLSDWAVSVSKPLLSWKVFRFDQNIFHESSVLSVYKCACVADGVYIGAYISVSSYWLGDGSVVLTFLSYLFRSLFVETQRAQGGGDVRGCSSSNWTSFCLCLQAKVNNLNSAVVVIRIMRDLCNRVPTWTPLSGWVRKLLLY